VVPSSHFDRAADADRMRQMIRTLNNAWWFSHRVLKSSARMVYGSVYEIPAAIGPVNISTFGSILLHLRDPLLALQKGASLTSETIIVTDLIWPVCTGDAPLPKTGSKDLLHGKPNDAAVMWFYPNPGSPSEDQRFTWWHLSPELIVRFVQLLGFTNTRVSFHRQKSGAPPNQQTLGLFTVVGQR
jgi:hypothetical protein